MKTYWDKDERRALDLEDLQDMFANADATRGCLGHGKSEANKRNREEFREELARRGVAPDGREGRFNGPGAT